MGKTPGDANDRHDVGVGGTRRSKSRRVLGAKPRQSSSASAAYKAQKMRAGAENDGRSDDLNDVEQGCEDDDEVCEDAAHTATTPAKATTTPILRKLEPHEIKCGPRATYMRNQAIKATIQKLRVKNKRMLFLLARTTRHVTDQSFFPRCGFTAGQFCVLQALNEGSRSKRTT